MIAHDPANDRPAQWKVIVRALQSQRHAREREALLIKFSKVTVNLSERIRSHLRKRAMPSGTKTSARLRILK